MEKVKVKDIQFAYNNMEVIEILKLREGLVGFGGSAITNCEWDKVNYLNA